MLYLARRYFQLSPQEWDELGWDVQRCYIDGLAEEGVLESEGGGRPGEPEPDFTYRTAETGAEVFDFAAMQKDLDAVLRQRAEDRRHELENMGAGPDSWR